MHLLNQNEEINMDNEFEFYAFEESGGGIRFQGCASKNKEHIYDYKNNKYLNKNNAEFMCVSTFTKGGSPRNRSVKNIQTINCSYLDIDSSTDISVDDILNRCKLLDIPLPTYILNTSANHYHIFWYYINPLNCLTKTSYPSYWNVVQQGLIKAFKDLSPDPAACDPVRYLRNPLNIDGINKKRNNYRVSNVFKSSKTHLRDIYKTLKEYGYIDNKKSKITNVPLHISRAKLYSFLKENIEFTQSQKHLAHNLNIPLRTLCLLIKELKDSGKLLTKCIGKGKNRKTHFTFIIEMHRSNNSILIDTILTSGKPHEATKCSPKLAHGVLRNQIIKLISIFNQMGLPEGYRDIGCFTLARILAGMGYKQKQIINKLSDGFLRSQSNGNREFEEGEFYKCIKNGSNIERYIYFPWKYFNLLIQVLGINTNEYRANYKKDTLKNNYPLIISDDLLITNSKSIN